jgi:hypothetical protein
MTETIDEHMPATEPSTKLLGSLYRQDAEGLMPDDRSRLAWQYSNIFGICGPGIIEKLAALPPDERSLQARNYWRSILDAEKMSRWTMAQPSIEDELDSMSVVNRE